MKKYLSIILVLAMCLSLVASCGNEPANTPAPSGDPAPSQGGEEKPLAGNYDIKIWVADAIVELTKTQIDNFNATNDMGIVLNATVEAVGEGDAATSMTTDVESGADLFGFAQDQTARLIQAGAVAELGSAASEFVKNGNDSASVTAVTSGDKLYGYPMTSDNGYFLYYDKSVLSDEDVKDMSTMIAAAKAAGKNISFELENGWYVVSYFFGVGCLSEWQTDDAGKFVSVNDNFNSDKGLIAAQGISELVNSGVYVNSSNTTDFEAAIPSCAVVSGTWNYENAKSILGDNLGVAKLPTFTVDGTSYQIGSFNGCKLMGVKPQSDAKRAAVMHQVAQYLTGEACQLERFNANGWGPSNLAAQGSDAVKAAPHLVALMDQNNYSRPQGQIHGSWWDIGKVIPTEIKAGTDLQTVLDNYKASMEALFTMSDDVLNAWTVIGNINGDGWSVDLPMTETDGIWKTTEAYAMDTTTEFKVRQGKSWDVNYGADGAMNGANVTVAEAGTYYVVFDSATGLITLEAAG